MAGRLVQRPSSDGWPPLRDVTATIQQGICVVDADLRVVSCDRRFVELLDYPPELGQTGRLVTDLVEHQIERGHCGPRDGRALVPSRLHPGRDLEPEIVSCSGAGGRAVELCTWPLPDGGFVQVCTSTSGSGAGHAEADAAPAVGEDGAAGAAGEPRPPPAGPVEPDRRLADVAEAGSDWLWESDADLRLTYLSPQFASQTGIPDEQLIGRSLLELANDAAGRADGGRHAADLRARRPLRDLCHRATHSITGASRHVRVSGKAVFDRAGRFTGYRGTGADITAEVEATQSAARAEARLRDAIDSVNDGFALFDDRDRLVICNRRFAEIDAVRPDLAAPGSSWEAILRAGIAAGHYVGARGRADAYLAERLEHRCRADGKVLEQQLGDRRWIQICEYRTSDGGTVSTRADITELKRRESAPASS